MKKIEELQSILRKDFKAFAIKVFTEIAGNSSFSDNWHIDVICDELMGVVNGKNNKLVINIPPRHMKSILCSVALPAFMLGQNPKTQIICVSYSDDLAAKMALDCRRVIESLWYKELFPATRLSKEKKGISDFETTKGGGRFATSIGGTLTGRGGDIAIVDDPISPRDANSDTVREKTNDWYGGTLASRLNDKNTGKIIVIMQRTHEADFTGYLLETSSAFKQIKIPAITEEDEKWKITDYFGKEKVFERKIGEPLHPERESLEKLKETKNEMGSYNFASQYQQNPTSPGGNLIKREWLKFYNLKQLAKDIREGRIKAYRISQSWDTASKAGQDNDYSVCITYLSTYGDKNYILHVFREKLEFPDLVKKAKELKEKAQKVYSYLSPYFTDIIVEEMSSGIGLAQSLKEKYPSIVKPFKPEHDKPTRLKNISHLIENGSCLFPDNKPSWWSAFERELLTFPASKHDDQCDALSQLLTYEITETTNLDWIHNL